MNRLTQSILLTEPEHFANSDENGYPDTGNENILANYESPLSSTGIVTEASETNNLFGVLGSDQHEDVELEQNDYENYYLSSTDMAVGELQFNNPSPEFSSHDYEKLETNDKSYYLSSTDTEAEATDLQNEMDYTNEEEALSDDLENYTMMEQGDIETENPEPSLETADHEWQDQDEATDMLLYADHENIIDKETSEIIEHQAAIAKSSSVQTKACEGHICWAKDVLNRELGLSLAPDNRLDEQAKKAIGVFQANKNLSASQRIDPPTERALLEADALRRHKGTVSEQASATVISTAKTKIEDWTKQAVNNKPQHILNQYRDPRKIFALVLHHMAFKRRSRKTNQFSDPNSYLATGAHFCIMMDGRIIQLHPFSRMIWHSNCTSPGSVGVEFEGNFPNIKGGWWIDKKSNIQNKDHPTQAQFDSGRFLISYLKIVLGTTHVFAHRQSSKDRENDPGPDIWYKVGQWAIENLGMKDTTTAKCGDGNTILPQWIAWGNKTTERVVKEYAEENEATEWEEDYAPDDHETGAENYDSGNEYFLTEARQIVKDWAKSIRLNRYYSDKLGWNQYHDQINNFLLPYSGLQNVSLGEEAFAQAVASWQTNQGFLAKDCDGIIGPDTWKAMSKLLFQTLGSASVKNNPVNISGTVATGSIETPPVVFSSDKVPAGFRQNSYDGWQGLDKTSTVRVDETARRINSNGVLQKYGITETDIDTFQRISSAETGGHIQNFYSLDTAIVSIGFRQFTFIHGNIHNWINKAPAAFKRYGIEIDDSLPPYIIKRKTGEYKVKRIKGVDDPETLRWNGWAQRFYYAGLDHEIIIAEFLLAKEYFAKELGRLKSHLKNSPDQFTKFMGFYNQSGHVRAFFHELNNAAPSRVPSITAKALIKVNSNQSSEQFLQTYFQTAKENWPNPKQVERIFENTNKGSGIKVFETEDELIYTEAYEENDPQNENEMYSYETDQMNDLVYTPFSNEFDSLVTDRSRAVALNRHYADKLGWNQFHNKINELLLPLSGLQNVNLGEDAFAQAVSEWQKQQGFSEKDSDGIIGPMTWRAMQSFINTNRGYQPVIKVPSGDTARSTQNIFEFNRWHAQKIIDTMNNGILSHNFKSKDQLEKIAGGEQVLFINPRTQLIKILPVIYHIAKQAQSENYKEIIIGSFIRGANSEGKCTGHCAGRCIDINYRNGSFETAGSVQMVKNILSYLISLPAPYKKSFGFGMPLQGSFFGDKSLAKFKSASASNLVNADLQQLVSQLGIVFPDNNNHLHIQVNWEVNSASDQETAAERNNIFLPAI